MEAGKEELIAIISEAFRNAKLEDGIGLSEADAINGYKDAACREACGEKDEKHYWNKISSALLNQFYCSLCFFDANGMKFHLPAFMIANLRGEYNFGMTFLLTHLSEYSKSPFSLLSVG